MNNRFLLGMALSLWAASALAATPVDETRPLDPDGRVTINNLKGRISVRTWDRAEVRVTGTLGEGVEKVAIDGSRGSLDIKVVYPNSGDGLFGWWGRERGGPSEIEVTIPVKAEVSAQGVSADIDIRDVQGSRLSAQSVSGGIEATGAPGEASFQSVSGSVRSVLDGSSVSAETVSGGIDIEGRPGDRIEVESVSGDIRVTAGKLRRFDASTVSGSLDMEIGALARGGRITAETLSGRLELMLPASTSATLSIETFSGSIRSDAGEVKKPRHGPGASLDARLGDGDGEIRLESFSGSVRVRMQ